MRNKIICVVHGEHSRTGRIGDNIRAKSFEEVRCCIPTGDCLPVCLDDIAGAVVFGGPMSANDDDKLEFLAQELRWIDKVMAADVPFLGVCLGAQMLARVLGATVKPHDEGWHEIGFCEITPTEAGEDIVRDLRHVYHWHGEGFDMPSGAELLATGASGHFPNQFYRVGKQAYGLQFHPECTRDIIESWMKEASERLSEPGAQQPEEQIARANRYDHLVNAWVPGFLDTWLDIDSEAKEVRLAAS